MHTGVFVYVVAGALCAGMVIGLVFHISLWIVSVSLAGAVFLFVLAAVLRLPGLWVGAGALAAVATGMLRSEIVIQQEASETLATYIGQKAEVAGRVVEDPDRRETSLHVTIQVETVRGVPTSGKLLALIPRNAKVLYNDTVVVEGQLVAPKTFQTDAGHTFDYPGYLRAQGISTQIQRATLTSAHAGGWTVLGPLYALKHAFEHSLERLYPEPDGSLEEGILLGEKHGIPQSLTTTFIQSGLVHMVVLSGYNIAIVSEGVFRALSFLPQTWGLGVGGGVMILFSLMTGAGAATIRALLMALVGLLARYLHRATIALRSLVLAATGMALWNPEGLLHDSSFLLSVLATFGLITLSPWVERGLPTFLTRYESVRSIAASTIAVQLYVLPALLYFSGVLSLVSVPANILALPVVPMAMLMGFIAGIVGLVSPWLGFIPAILSDILLKWILLVAHVASSVPFGSVIVGEFTPWLLVGMYVPLTWFAVRKYQQNSRTEQWLVKF